MSGVLVDPGFVTGTRIVGLVLLAAAVILIIRGEIAVRAGERARAAQDAFLQDQIQTVCAHLGIQLDYDDEGRLLAYPWPEEPADSSPSAALPRPLDEDPPTDRADRVLIEHWTTDPTGWVAQELARFNEKEGRDR